MLHNLIDSAENWKYQPFAKSCINKLKRLGMAYANQSYEIDGVSIKVRIEPGHEYIRIDGGYSMQMDSGVVDLGNLGTESPFRYSPGKLYATDYYTSYTTGFTNLSNGWRTNPATGSKKQLAGNIVSSGGIKGKIRPDGHDAASFSPSTRAPVSDDDALYQKKAVTSYCPASMFTGKCRLWVQAMYGRPMYAGGVSQFSHINIGGISGRPWLKIDGSKKVESTKVNELGETYTAMDYPVVGITTNCGVYLDKPTGKHWFVDISDHQGTAMPLVSSAAGEALRKKLKAHYAGDPELTAQDAEHLEAFILSECRPDPTQQQTFSFGPTKPVWSLGYGWHWNWSGTAADFVCTEAFTQDDSTEFNPKAASRSTHFRVSLTFASGAFTAVSFVVSGPTDWTLVPSQWCVLEPDWSTGSASKLTQPRTTLFACSATFYAYYNRDDLITCSVNVTEIDDSQDNFYDESEAWSGPFTVSQGASYGNTLGMLDGYHKHRTANYDKGYVAVFTCGGVTTEWCYYNRAWTEEVYSISNKTMTTYPTEILFDYGFIPADQSYPSGYPPYTSTSLYSVPDEALPPTVEYDFKSHVENVTHYSYAHILVPFLDAEAVTVRSESHKHTTYTNDFKGRYATGGLQTLYRPKIFIRVPNDSPEGFFAQNTGTRGEFLAQGWYAMQQENQTPVEVSPKVPDNLTDTDETLASVSKLVAAGSVIDADIPDKNDYKDISLTNVDVHYEVRSGVQEGSNAVVVAPGIGAQQGVAHEFYNPTIVGWA